MAIMHELLEPTENKNGEPVDNCSCGASWSHPKSRSKEKRQEIFIAHCSYFNRPATRVD